MKTLTFTVTLSIVCLVGMAKFTFACDNPGCERIAPLSATEGSLVPVPDPISTVNMSHAEAIPCPSSDPDCHNRRAAEMQVPCNNPGCNREIPQTQAPCDDPGCNRTVLKS